MNVQRVVQDLSTKYPGKKILVEEENGYVEIVVELEQAMKRGF